MIAARRLATWFGVLALSLGLAGIVETLAAYAFPSVLAVDVAPTVAAPGNRPRLLVALGDSLAAGQGASPGHAWVDDFRQRLSTRAPGSEVVDLGVRGARVPDALAQLARASGGDADAVFVVAGTNDVLSLVDPLSLADDEDRLLLAIRARYPHAALVVTNVPDLSAIPVGLFLPHGPRPAGLARLLFGWWNALDNIAIERVANRFGAHVIDFRSMLRARDPVRDASDDGFHPSDRGYAKLAAATWPALSRALGFAAALPKDSDILHETLRK